MIQQVLEVYFQTTEEKNASLNNIFTEKIMTEYSLTKALPNRPL